MASNQNPKRGQPQPNSASPQTPQPRRRKVKVIDVRYKHGANDIWIRVSPKFAAAIISAVVTLIVGVSTTANVVLQARPQSPALPSQRVAEDSR